MAKRLVVPYQANLLVECETDGAEGGLKTAAHQRVQPVGGDDQIVSLEFVHRLDRRAVSGRNACRVHALLQDGQEFEPADRGEADAVDFDALPAQVQRDVLPALHPRRDGVHGIGIVGAQKFQRLLGEHHAEAPGRAFGVLLEQIDLRVRVTPLPEIGEVETAGASADHGDTHVFLPIDSMLTNWPRVIREGGLRHRKIGEQGVSTPKSLERAFRRRGLCRTCQRHGARPERQRSGKILHACRIMARTDRCASERPAAIGTHVDPDWDRVRCSGGPPRR